MSRSRLRALNQNEKIVSAVNRKLQESGATPLRLHEHTRAVLVYRNYHSDGLSGRVPTIVTLYSLLIVFISLGFASNVNLPVNLYILLGVSFLQLPVLFLWDLGTARGRSAGEAALIIIDSRL